VSSLILLQGLEEIPAVTRRHHQIKDDQMGMDLLEKAERLFGIGRLDQSNVCCLEIALEETQDIRVIINDQDRWNASRGEHQAYRNITFAMTLHIEPPPLHHQQTAAQIQARAVIYHARYSAPRPRPKAHLHTGRDSYSRYRQVTTWHRLDETAQDTHECLANRRLVDCNWGKRIGDHEVKPRSEFARQLLDHRYHAAQNILEGERLARWERSDALDLCLWRQGIR
jgi:hypothetical protein